MGGKVISLPAQSPAVRKREVFGYCMFDFANSSYTTLITTVAYALYFKQVVAGDAANGDFLWSVAKSLAMVVLILTSPIFGALADHSGRKKTFLLLTTLMTIAACASLWFVTPGAITLGIVLFVIGSVGFEGGYVFYNAFLPEVSTPKTIGRISGWSWGTGFLGGLAALVVCSPFLAAQLRDESGRLVPEAVASWRLSFVVVALFFAVFAIPAFIFLRERTVRRPMRPFGRFVSAGFRRVRSTISHLREYRNIARLTASSFFFYGAIQIIIDDHMIVLMLITNFNRIPFQSFLDCRVILSSAAIQPGQ